AGEGREGPGARHEDDQTADPPPALSRRRPALRLCLRGRLGGRLRRGAHGDSPPDSEGTIASVRNTPLESVDPLDPAISPTSLLTATTIPSEGARSTVASS